jgi:hypothetical protein
MGNGIKKYEDLLEEKKRLQLLLVSQKQFIRNDIGSIKQSLKPVKVGYSVVSRFFSKGSRSPVMQLGSQIFTSIVLRILIRKRIGWIKRRVFEILIGNFFANTLKPVLNLMAYKLIHKIRPQSVPQTAVLK